MVELQKELVLARDFGQEVLAAEFHGRIELVVGKALESFDAEVLPIRGPTDGGFMSWDASVEFRREDFLAEITSQNQFFLKLYHSMPKELLCQHELLMARMA